jgi:molybdopterin synthase catalytic subunit
MTLLQLIETVKSHPRFSEAGMILCHNGIVRGTSRDGRAVRGLEVTVDVEQLNDILESGRSRPGIIDVRIAINADRYLAVGEDVMYLVIAGDIRERVIDTLREVLDAVKTRATRKTEYFIDAG